MPRMFRLDNKVVLITGATGHLGHAMCTGLAEAGARLAVCSTSLDKADGFARELKDRFQIDASGFELNLESAEAIPQVVTEIAESMGSIDCLVNNACFAQFNSLEEITLEQWDSGLKGGVTSPFFLMQACIPHLEKSQGAIVNISSMYGMVSPKPQNYEGTPFGSSINYGAAKAALLQVTRFAAAYLAPMGVRVNAISPGPFPMGKVLEDELFMSRLASNVPLGRIGQPEEIKGAVVFLASPASSYMTGQNLVIDGGWTIW